MITINGHKLVPTVFPDKTTQVWKLPEWLFKHSSYWIDWRWENESEVIQLAQLMHLLTHKNPEGASHTVLYSPYLPYARQDKNVENNETFALRTMAAVINTLAFEKVISLDVHNESVADSSIRHFQNIPPVLYHQYLLKMIDPELIVFPDHGAWGRYPHLHDRPNVCFQKKRDQSTGQIIGHALMPDQNNERIKDAKNILVVDDICDGGATFISVAKAIDEINQYADYQLSLAVTHGLFSKGLSLLQTAGFNSIWATNSIKNCTASFEV